MRNRLLISLTCFTIASGVFVFGKPPTTKPSATASDSTMSDTMMSDTMMSDSMMAMSADHAGATPLTPTQLTFFETKVRPILANKCYKCHSVEQHKSKGGLVLDSLDGWKKGGEDGQVIVPGNPDKSMLIQAVRYKDEDLQMPPDKKKLSDDEIETLVRWVKIGAPDPRVAGHSKLTGLNDKARAHWSYHPLKIAPVPTVRDTTWGATPIDAFILAKLEQNNIKPSRPASRETLIRRATYDLTGLPPTPEEVMAFKNDPSPDAFEKVVDRLLGSPHFGERWGRYWLDTARYSDTSGDDKKTGEYRYPYAWTYRDYVIQAFNNDKPYDEFLKEQLAADQLAQSKDDPSRLAALGFLTVGKRFQNPNDTIDERIDAIGRGMLGITVACARCHDHKFDPIPQADYYSLHGVFSSITEPVEKPLICDPAKNPDYADFQKQLAVLEQKDRDLYYDLVDSKAREFRKQATNYLLASLLGRRNKADEIILRDKIIADNKLERDIYANANRFIFGKREIFGPILEVAYQPEDKLAENLPRILARAAAGGPKQRPLNPLVVQAFREISPGQIHSLQDVAEIYGKLFASIDSQANDYLAACRTATTPTIPGYDDAVTELFNVPAIIEPAPALTTTRLTELAPQLPIVNGQGYNRLNLAEINQLLLTHPGSPARAMVVEDLPKPHNSFVFIRGEANNHGPIAPRQFLEILSGNNRKPFTQGSGRLELANDIASKDNPLTARVMVNRIWMHLFGQGFVRTPDDLGVQSEPPSHPELLDYLAKDFMDNGWSMKHMIRTIMLTNSYQQSSDTNPAYAVKDSENRLLWRANLRRLDFEAMRDSLLMFTGKLDPTIGGKPVNLTDEPYSNRRSIYGYIDRGTVPELLSQFDFADPDMVNSHRTSTIVPQQALFFMNSPMSIDVARKVTTRPEFLSSTSAAMKIRALYEVLFQRQPTEKEIAFGIDFLKQSGGDALVSSKPLTPAQIKQAKITQARYERQQQALETFYRKQATGKVNSRAPIHNLDGDIVARRPLTPWEQYAQALLFTNEIAYVN